MLRRRIAHALEDFIDVSEIKCVVRLRWGWQQFRTNSLVHLVRSIDNCLNALYDWIFESTYDDDDARTQIESKQKLE